MQMKINRSEKENELLIVFILSGFIAVCVALTRHITGSWAPLRSIDFASYWSGLQLFFSPNSPYDLQTMILKQRELSGDIPGQMVWNPPVLFVMLAPLLSLPLYWARVIWTIITTVSAILCAYLSWKLASDLPGLRFPVWILGGLFYCPYFYEMYVEQISSFLNLLLMLSLFLFMRGNHLWAGAVAGLLIIKPHVVYLVWIWYFVMSFLTKRWSFWIGFILSIVFGCIVAELLHPGINWQWLTRETWPTGIWGSTLPSLVRAASRYIYINVSFVPQTVIPLLGTLAVITSTWRGYTKSNVGKGLILAAILCPITSPYGFAFDQAILILPIMAILANAYNKASPGKRRIVILTELVAAQLGVIVLGGREIFGLPLSWFVLPAATLMIWIVHGCPSGQKLNRASV